MINRKNIKPLRAVAFSLIVFSWSLIPTGAKAEIEEDSCGINHPAMAAVFENPLRTQEDKSKDLHRRPDYILKFWGIGQDAKILDLEAGAGYYTKILSHYLKDGHVIAVTSDFLADNEKFSDRIESIKALDERQDNVTRMQGRFDTLDFPDNLNGVLFINFYHDTLWLDYDRRAMNDEIFKSLEPGGTYLIMDHAAEKGAGFSVGETLHRVEGKAVIEEVEKSGFRFVKQSDFLMRGDDILTQSAVKPEERRGKTARFIYLFEKPKAQP